MYNLKSIGFKSMDDFIFDLNNLPVVENDEFVHNVVNFAHVGNPFPHNYGMLT